MAEGTPTRPQTEEGAALNIDERLAAITRKAPVLGARLARALDAIIEGEPVPCPRCERLVPVDDFLGLDGRDGHGLQCRTVVLETEVVDVETDQDGNRRTVLKVTDVADVGGRVVVVLTDDGTRAIWPDDWRAHDAVPKRPSVGDVIPHPAKRGDVAVTGVVGLDGAAS